MLSIHVCATQYIYERELTFRPRVYGDVRFPKEHVARNTLWAEAVRPFVHDVEVANFCRESESSTNFPPVVKQLRRATIALYY